MKLSIADYVSVFLIVLLGSFLVGLLVSYPLMLLWNYCLVPAIPGIQEVSVLQMWGITVLVNVMAKSNLTVTTKG